MHILIQELLIPSDHYKKILLILKSKGGEARVIGGAVRDSILGKVNHDIDIATNLLPDEVINILSDANIKVKSIGKIYGTVTAILEGEKFEITTLRKDIKCDGRYAEVVFTNDFALDAARRDFTINALSYCPFKHEIYDYFCGINDLQNKKVTFIGEALQRIKEDFLRILRFFRFSCYYAEQLDAENLNACIELKEDLKLLSKERIKAEIDKLLLSDNSPYILDKMFENRILQILFPIVNYDKNLLLEAINYSHKIALTHSLREEDYSELERKKSPVSEGLYLNLDSRYSLLLYHIKDLRLSDLLNLKFSKREAKKIISLLSFANLAAKVDGNILRKIWFNHHDYHQYILVLIAVKKIDFVVAEKFIKTYSFRKIPLFPINGYDIQQKNIPTKDRNVILQKLKDLWIDSDFILGKEQLLKML